MGGGREDESADGDFVLEDAAVCRSGNYPDEIVVDVFNCDVKGSLVGVEPGITFTDGVTLICVGRVAVVGEVWWIGANNDWRVVGDGDPAVNCVDVDEASGAVPPQVADVDGVAVVVVGWWGGARLDDDR